MERDMIILSFLQAHLQSGKISTSHKIEVKNRN